MARCYVYVVARDFGFAPNPFHGVCTLATCKPPIRARAQVGDWVFGLGGRRLKAAGNCIFAMRVTGTLSFSDYWDCPRFLDKRPVRNGSAAMMVGDNIYHLRADGSWQQEDSHHSNPDGTPNPFNLAKDTLVDRVLVSTHFYYFGSKAPVVPSSILKAMSYKNGRGYRVYEDAVSADLTAWLETRFAKERNTVAADPFDFEMPERRYSTFDNKLR